MGKRLVDASLQLVEPRLEDAALRFGIRCELSEAPAQIGFGGRDARLERARELFALTFERARRLVEPALETLRRGLTDVRETLAENAFRLVREGGDRAVELA